MPDFEVGDSAVHVAAHATPFCSPDDVIGAGDDVGFVSVCLGSGEDAV
eukprot:CAMPEP_0182496156 /NCGR_PEP_ID=MMETSP1321-20130603/4834_1 /TAXON_ID=91990 /ORGANISM="Bolidomonas sp., Strain RCC1657" /LENGTH=47 /DNA_ID= /DNA_START= /DNA_END= /DNA_ORIENTATION=